MFVQSNLFNFLFLLFTCVWSKHFSAKKTSKISTFFCNFAEKQVELKDKKKKKPATSQHCFFPSAHKRALMHRLVESNPSKIEFKMEKEKV